MSEHFNPSENALKEAAPGLPASEQRSDTDFDPWLLIDSLAKTPWERMLANDDALNFGESLRLAMNKRHAKSE